jgi:hypothetical protein
MKKTEKRVVYPNGPRGQIGMKLGRRKEVRKAEQYVSVGWNQGCVQSA